MEKIKTAVLISLFVFFIGGMYSLPLEYAGAFLVLMTGIITYVVYGNTKKLAPSKFWLVLLGGISLSFFLGYFHVINSQRFFSQAEKYWGSFLLFTAGYILISTFENIIQIVMKVFISGIAMTSFIGIITLTQTLIDTHRLPLLNTPLGMSNDYGSILIIGILLMLGIILFKHILFSRMIDRVILGFFCIALVFVRSDANALGLIIGFILLMWPLIPVTKKTFFKIAFIVIFCCTLTVAVHYRHYFLRSGNAVRIALWHGYSKMILKYPFTGVGLSQMPYHYDEWKVPVPFTKQVRMVEPLTAHSLPVQYAAENGIPALLLLCFFLYRYWKTCIRKINPYYGVFAGFVAFSIAALFSNHFFMIRQMLYFWFLAGCYLAHIHQINALKKS